MNRRILLWLALPISAMAVAQEVADQIPDGPPILRKAFQNAQKLRYAGTRTVEFRRGGSDDRHDEVITRDGSNIRIEFPEGSKFAGQIIVENSRERKHFFPDRNEIHILPPRREEAFDRLLRLLSGKNRVVISTAPGQSVAGRRTEQVVISDRSGNVMQRLYIEPDSGLILKKQLFDPVGAPVGGFEFRTVDMNPRVNRGFFRIVRRGATVLTPADLLERLAKERGFAVVVLPLSSGYRLEGSFARDIGGSDVLVQMYGSKAGRRLTLFQLKKAVSPDRLRAFARDEDLKSVTWQSGGRTFVLVGNLDESALRSVAQPISGGTGSTGR